MAGAADFFEERFAIRYLLLGNGTRDSRSEEKYDHSTGKKNLSHISSSLDRFCLTIPEKDRAVNYRAGPPWSSAEPFLDEICKPPLYMLLGPAGAGAP